MTGVTGRRVLVLGGSGFLGRAAVEALVRHGARVTAVSRGEIPTPTGGRDRVESVRLDLTAEPGALRELLAERTPTAVVNAAGRVWGLDRDVMDDLNDRLVGELVAALPRAPRLRLIHLGSSYEYGPLPGRTPVRETRRPAPDTAYARSKLNGTRHVLAAARSGRVDGVVLRVANVSGPGAPAAGLLGSVARRLAEFSRAPEPYGDGVLRLEQLRGERDFVDVRDVADAVVRAVAAPAAVVGGRVVNIGGGRAVHVRALVERLIELSGLPVQLRTAAADAPTARTTTDWQQLDISRARRLLGWRPRYGLDQSLRDLLSELDVRLPEETS